MINDAYRDLGLSAQTTYAELFDRTQGSEIFHSVSNLSGNFFKRDTKSGSYWYYGYRDVDGTGRMIYVGPDSERISRLAELLKEVKSSEEIRNLSNACIAYGFEAMSSKHFKILKKLSEYGLFRAGGVLVGTHAFLAYGNMFGVKWANGFRTMDLDIAHPGNNVSIALPSDIKIDVHSAIESLEMGLIPITEFGGRSGAQYRNEKDSELRIDFLTSMTRDGLPAVIDNLNIALEPLKFMEFSLESTTQGCILSKSGACVVNVPDPSRFAVHKLIVYGERSVSEQAKSRKDLVQAYSIIKWMTDNDRIEEIENAFADALGRRPGWKKRIEHGLNALQDKFGGLSLNLLDTRKRSKIK